MTIPIRASSEIIRNMPRFVPREDIPSMIANVCKNPYTRPVPGAKSLSVCEINNKRVFFVHKDLQKEINFCNARSGILSHLKLAEDTKILQVIGDCIPFSKLGTERAKDILPPILEKPNQLLLWGYTGSQKDHGRRLDINQILNTWVDESPLRGNQVLANVLDIDTPRALKEWNCLGSETTKNFYLVNGDATFGEDIASSDFLTDKACCFDGGIQSFRQMMNLLMRDIDIQCYHGFREKKNVVQNTYFSAVEFIKFIRGNIQEYYKYNNLTEGKIPEKMEVANEFLELWRDSYLEIHPLYNPEVNDPSNRDALFQVAWNLFLEKELWKKLNLCQFSAV
ncbi:MAG: hypothetical protein ACRCSV_01240 [Chlamydiales bacterium]